MRMAGLWITSEWALVWERAEKPSRRQCAAITPAISAPRMYARIDCEALIQSSPEAPSMVS